MKLHEIIKINDEQDQSAILYDEIAKYKKSLYIYYKDYFSGEPVLMVTDVFNAAQYCKIVSEHEFIDAINAYLDDYNCSDENSENFAEYETICFNSVPLKDLIN